MIESDADRLMDALDNQVDTISSPDENFIISELHRLKQPGATWKLGRPDGSQFHNMNAAATEQWPRGAAPFPKIVFPFGDKSSVTAIAIEKQQPHVFLIEHDWHGAFVNATDFEGGEWRPPYDITVYEMMIDSLRVCAWLKWIDPSELGEPRSDRGAPLLMVFIKIPRSRDRWMFLGPMTIFDSGESCLLRQEWAHGSPLATLKIGTIVSQQIRAIAITLDAEIVSAEINRAPHRLNTERVKRGKLPLYDFHTLSLANRGPRPLPRQPDPYASDEPHHQKRLHFRRGHWRHYQSHKTWIKWMLVGNPDLGRIEKAYRL